METREEYRKRRWKERLVRWQKKMGSKEAIAQYHNTYRRKWASLPQNKERIKGYRKNWEANNLEAARAKRNRKSKKYYARKKDRLTAYKKAYYLKHRERLLQKSKDHHAANRERRNSYIKRWQKANPEKVHYHGNKRRALELAAQGNLITIQAYVRSVKSRRTAVCYYCGTRFASSKVHFDHIVPLAKGGAHSAENLCVSCPPCNRRKHTKLLPEFKIEGQQLLFVL